MSKHIFTDEWNFMAVQCFLFWVHDANGNLNYCTKGGSRIAKICQICITTTMYIS
jgi:hypothetical protein